MADPLESCDLLDLSWTVRDLARERPGVRVSELAELLNLEIEVATALAHAAVEDSGVSIEFDIGLDP